MNNPNKITDQRPQPELLSCTGSGPLELRISVTVMAVVDQGVFESAGDDVSASLGLFM